MALHAMKHDSSPSQDDEARLDQTIEDSFPASDPPSSTPLTSIGPREHRLPDEPLRSLLERAKQVPIHLLIAGAGAAVAIGVLILEVRRARRPKPNLLARAAPEMSKVVGWRPPKARASWKKFRGAA